MPAFQAINLEPEENIDEQIDTTKELHVDEALKRFQNALKLQAQGVRSRLAASAAYTELFESEIFKYHEARTEYERAELQSSGRPEVLAPELFSQGLDIGAGGADGVAANLSMALYLSFKNYGHFFLDKLKDCFDSDPQWQGRRQVYYGKDEGNKILDNWTAALDQDPSDPELWRKASRLAASMNSGRIKRYCLEAAIELDDDPTVMEVEPPSLAESLAGEQLKGYLQHLGDDLALSHPVMLPWLRKQMPMLVKRHLDPIPFLPDPTVGLRPLKPSDLTVNGDLSKDHNEDAATSISEASSTDGMIASWCDLGLELIKCVENTPRALQACEDVLKAKLHDTDMERGESETQDPGQAMLSEVEKTSNAEQHDDHAAAASQPESKDSQVHDNAEDTAKASSSVNKEQSSSIPTRKRSQSAAGLPESVEEENVAEKRSKRVRRRVETVQNEEHTDLSTMIANQLRDCQDADQCLFQITKNLLETLGIEDKDAYQHLDETLDLCVAEDRNSKFTRLTAKDLRRLIANFDEDTALLFISKKEQASLGLSSFLEHAKTGSQERIHTAPFDEVKGLTDFADEVGKHSDRITGEDIAFGWLRAISPSYTSFKWSEQMKTTVVSMLDAIDPFLHKLVWSEVERWPASADRLGAYEAMISMILELRIEAYERITGPGIHMDYATQINAKYKLERWFAIASVYIRLLDRMATDVTCVRFMWASVMVSSLSEHPIREHILMLWTSLRDFLTQEDLEPIHLPNSTIVPTISPAAADREISKLTTMDFFLGLFQDDMEDPVHVIETLEPVLNPSTVYVYDEDASSPATPDSVALDDEQQPNGKAVSDCANQGLRDLWKFLRSSSTELRLFLWSRLGDAYEAIKYPTKRFSCHLKSIEMIVADLESEKYANVLDDSRQLLFVRTLKSLDELLIQALSLALNDTSAFEIIDNDHVQSSTSALAKVSCLLHVAALCEDEIRIGVTAAPSSNSTFQSLITKFREMQVRAWCLQYTIFKASFPLQNSLAPEKDLADFLAAVHQVIGLRKGCKVSNKIFLKIMRMELLKNQSIDNWEDYLGQVVYDLYGLKLGVGEYEVQDHGCPTEKLEKRQAMQLVEKAMILANRMSMKDLLKSDLKTTIERIQQIIGQTKSTMQMVHNLRNFTEMLKKPIHPLRLYQALSGGVSVDAVTINTPEAALASHSWFFLLGMIAFTKFKAVDLNRRQIPGATDDLRVAATFLRLQLQFTADRWEAWFRLAECFDFELDEAVLWTADKMNKDRPELVKFQRNAIHCYTLALSHSRHQDVSTSDGDPLHDLYHKFGMRLYASSREPFAMEPFQHSDHERFFIESEGTGTFKRILHEQMSEYKVWKFAAKLFKMAMERDPGNWKNSYMLAKCYWKMHQTADDKLEDMDRKSRISGARVLDALQKAISVAYNARKSRHSDPILEPHYKIVSILHKMVMRGDMPAKEAALLLSEQPFGVPLDSEDASASFQDLKDWEEYIIRNLAKLKEKDRSNWQHRIVARHAKILFDEDAPAEEDHLKVEVKAAFGILRENMFTKTMVMNVWKCDAERPGRHHVYTEQYVRFMTRLLVIMSDRANMEQLLRRLRKKGADFYHFTDLWQSCCATYLKLLRQGHHIPSLSDETFKSMSSEEFDIVSERITEWAAGDEADIPAFICMKEAIELKKLNANLMKAATIDDLIGDCYSKIYQDVASSLPGLEPSKIIEERNNHAKEVAARLEAAAEGEPKANSSLNSILNMPNADIVTGSATPLDADKIETAPKTKKTGVKRSDVLRKAEQAVVRSMEMPKSAHSRSRVGSLSSGKRGSQTPNAGVSDAGSDDEGPNAQMRREAGEDLDADMEDTNANEERDEDGEGADDSKMEDREELESEAGSLHDDADDESDLSDVPEGYDDDVPPGLLFPSLLGRDIQSAGTSGEDADSESEGEYPGETGGTGDNIDQTEVAEEEPEEEPEEEQEAEEEMSHEYNANGTLEDGEETEIDEDATMTEADTMTFSMNESLEMGH